MYQWDLREKSLDQGEQHVIFDYFVLFKKLDVPLESTLCSYAWD